MCNLLVRKDFPAGSTGLRNFTNQSRHLASRSFSNFSTLSFWGVAADLQNLASPTLEEIVVAAAYIQPFRVWNLPALKVISVISRLSVLFLP
jgi:hypothetical protein